MNILCELGLHKWGKVQIHFDFESNIKDYEKKCLRCGRIKKWNVVG
jgi:hypothetical protein